MVVTSPGTVSGLVVSFDTGFFARSDPPPPPPPPPTPSSSSSSSSTSPPPSSMSGRGGGMEEGGGEGGGEDQDGGGRPKASWFSTGPESRPTHWKQTLLWLRPKDKPEGLEKGDAVAGRLTLHRDEINPRELRLTVTWTATRQSTGQTFGGTQKYSVA
ncbi:unnamed protein product [Laminaria digitata]